MEIDPDFPPLDLPPWPIGSVPPVKVSGPGGSRSDDGGDVLGLDEPDLFYARLTTRLGAAYGWEEVFPAANGTWATPLGQRTGTTSVNPAYEVSGNAVAGLPVVVVMRPGAWGGNAAGQEYLFQHCCVGTVSGSGSGGGGTVATSCCSDLPSTLTATITNGVGCACMATTLTLTWNGSIWYGTATVCTDKTLAIQLSCAGGGTTCASMAAYVVCGGEELLETMALGCTCDPLALEYSLAVDHVSCCTNTGDTATLTITE